MKHYISVATNFSQTPGPRLPAEGDHSGEEFRERILKPAFKEALLAGENLTVDLDGTYGYACGWLEEAFGGLARELDPKVVLERLELVSFEEEFLIHEIEAYIMEARGSAYELEHFGDK